jgi:YD repeat-containing protein
VTQAYDKVGNVVAVKDPRQNIFGYAYDASNGSSG